MFRGEVNYTWLKSNNQYRPCKGKGLPSGTQKEYNPKNNGRGKEIYMLKKRVDPKTPSSLEEGLLA